MISKKIRICLPEGLEARPIALLVQVASQYESSVYVECGDKKVNSILKTAISLKPSSRLSNPKLSRIYKISPICFAAA